jgi:hypothetical protein
MEDESDNELDELQESTIKKKLLSSTRDGTDAVINHADSSTNQKLQEYYEHLRTVREILLKNSGRGLFRQNLTVSSNLHYYVQKQVQLLCLLSMNKCSVFS